MPQDDMDHIPAIVPQRDGAARPRAGGHDAARRGNDVRQEKAASGSGAVRLLPLLAAAALVTALLACLWSWQLQRQLQQADDQLRGYASRIGDLEARLSDTDEGMNQNAAVQAVKLAELESEVRKLWDNVWKQSKQRLDKLEAATAGQDSTMNDLNAALLRVRSQLDGVTDDQLKLTTIGNDVAQLTRSLTNNQTEVERVADNLNRINLDLAKLEKRVAVNEDWVASVNAFRRQANASLSKLQAQLRSLQASR